MNCSKCKIVYATFPKNEAYEYLKAKFSSIENSFNILLSQIQKVDFQDSVGLEIRLADIKKLWNEYLETLHELEGYSPFALGARDKYFQLNETLSNKYYSTVAAIHRCQPK